MWDLLPELLGVLTPYAATVSPILGVACAVITKVFLKEKKNRKQLAEVIDKSPLQNEDFHKIALKEGLEWGAKEIQKLFKKKS